MLATGCRLAAFWGSAHPGGVSVAHEVRNQSKLFCGHSAEKNLNLNHLTIAGFNAQCILLRY